MTVFGVILICGQHLTSDARNIAIGNPRFHAIEMAAGNSDIDESI